MYNVAAPNDTSDRISEETAKNVLALDSELLRLAGIGGSLSTCSKERRIHRYGVKRILNYVQSTNVVPFSNGFME